MPVNPNDTANSNPDIEEIASTVDMHDASSDGLEESREIDIPDLGERRSLGEDMRAASERAIQEETELRVKEEKNLKNPAGRARRLEKERDALLARLEESDSRYQDLQIELDRMRYAIQNPQYYAPQAQNQEPEIDDEFDPIGTVNRNVSKLQEEISSLKGQLQQASVEAYQSNLISQADRLIAHKIQENPEQNRAAMLHLANVMYKSASDTMPNLTSREKLQVTQDYVSQMKANWVAQGKNPGEELLKMAQHYGFNYQESEPEERPRVSQSRQQVQQSRNRKAATTSMGGIGGVAPANYNPASLKGVDADTFNHKVDDLIKSGQMRAGRTIGKTPKLSDLLPGKGIQVR